MANLRKTLKELKNLGLMSTVEKLVSFAKDKPGLLANTLIEIDMVLKNNSAEIPQSEMTKNQHIAVVGSIYRKSIKEAIISSVQTNHRVSPEKLIFYEDLVKIKNGLITESLVSDNCVGIIWGTVPHSIQGSPQGKLEFKSINALNDHGTLKLSKKTFDKAMTELLIKIKKSPPG